MGSGAAPWKILVLDPMLVWEDPPMVLCMISAHVFWTRWFLVHGIGSMVFWSMVFDVMVFQSMVLDASTCINMYCNIERNIMKIKLVVSVLRSSGKSLCICVLCVMLSHFYFSYDLEFVCR